tara:strand:- start:19285 stop:21168 length:1884 start_codon:yes stop_codon:yes gene_type:complete
MSVLEKLTEGIVNRDLQKEGAALLGKWERTGLLEGLNNDNAKSNMALLLENQAKELLRENSTMATGDVEGFAAVAFPIVRRVFGGLIANDLVSVQPMSLPSGLIFFLDFQFDRGKLGQAANDSLFGGGVVGQAITGGVDLGDSNATRTNAEKGFYSLNNGYSSPTGSLTLQAAFTVIASGTVGTDGADQTVTAASVGGSTVKTSLNKLVRYDPDLSGALAVVATVAGHANYAQLNLNNLITVSTVSGTWAAGAADSDTSPQRARLVRRLTTLVGRNADNANQKAAACDPQSASTSLLVVFTDGTLGEGNLDGNQSNGPGTDSIVHQVNAAAKAVTFAETDDFGGTAAAGTTSAIGAVVATSTWGLENNSNIPEIDIKVDSVSVTAITKKLKAKWTPELGQDLNAYHNLDAEVELTGILSEQIALEIDREILNDLVTGATADTLYWSRRPGKFLNRKNGTPIEGLVANESLLGADFTGTVSEWYETLVETINDVSAQIHRKTLRGGANFIVVGPEVANILEFTSGFRADVTGDTDRGTVGTVKSGSISKKWDVYVDPYFLRNVVLVGRKGGSFLESGYVYAPYVPLQVTPTIFGVEDFVPRKGVMTRYAKKMVRPDMYGLVVVSDMLG